MIYLLVNATISDESLIGLHVHSYSLDYPKDVMFSEKDRYSILYKIRRKNKSFDIGVSAEKLLLFLNSKPPILQGICEDDIKIRPVLTQSQIFDPDDLSHCSAAIGVIRERVKSNASAIGFDMDEGNKIYSRTNYKGRII